MRDDLRNRITGNGANEALSGLQQTLYEQLTAGRSLHEAIAALMTATERQMPGSHCAVLATWQAAPSPFLMHAVSDTLIEALDAADSSRQLDDWLAALMKEPGAPAALSFSALRASPALHDLYSAVSAGGVDDGLIAPIVLLDGRPIGMVLAGFDRMPAGPAACAVLEHAALLTAMVIQRHCSDARKAEYDLFRTAFDTALDATIVADAEGEAIVSVNSALTALLGYGAEELIGSTLSSLHEDPVGVMPLPDAGSATCRLRCKNGDILPAQCSMRIAEAGGRMMMFVTVRDATPKRAAEDSLTLTGKVYETMGEGAIIAGEDSVILSVNRALQAMTGYSTDEMVGRVPEFLYGEPTQWRRLVAHCMQTGLRGEEEIFVRHKDGRFFPCLLSVSVIRDDGGPSRIVAIYKDISLRRRQENHLRFLANHDVLTRLPNRTQFYKRLDMVIADANRDARSFAVLFIDLDRFKTVNDTFGHSAGDLLLQMVAERLRRNVRKTDMLARLGGDEFTVLAEMMPDVHNVMVLADHIMTALEEPFHIEGHELFVTASVGVSVFPHDGRDAETLIKSADTAMYHAKGLGKNNYQFFLAEMNTKALEHLQLESALRHALERNEFMLYYQPKVQVSTEDIFGMEALLRWNHPALGIIGPGRFIPLAEETGMIREIGCWALREACRQNAVWQRAGYPSLVVSVNLSSLQLVTLDFAETVAGILKETGLHASCLELELTESAIMESPEQSSITLQALRDMGVQISIDDFGTGYSSLSYLKRFPINTLKIDQSFVRDINIDANDAAITDAVISLARSLNMEVIAEGVETPEQLRYLQRNGCDAYQGFLFSRPLPSGEFQQLLTMNPPE